MTDKVIRVRCQGEVVLDEAMEVLRAEWEETSSPLEQRSMKHAGVREEKGGSSIGKGRSIISPSLSGRRTRPFSFVPANLRSPALATRGVLDLEMSVAFLNASFEPRDVSMINFLAGRIILERFRGLAAVGGFSCADVPEIAKGSAATITVNLTK